MKVEEVKGQLIWDERGAKLCIKKESGAIIDVSSLFEFAALNRGVRIEGTFDDKGILQKVIIEFDQ